MFEDAIIADWYCYDEEGNLKGTKRFTPPEPTRLQWDFDNGELVAIISEAFEQTQNVIAVGFRTF
jgi:hypothetical protein